MGPIAAAYDLIAAEYGWTDKRIGDLPLIRLRQIVAAIMTRKYHQERQENMRFSWLGRNLGVLIAAGYMVESDENPGIEFANGLSLDDVEAAMLRGVKDKPQEPEVKEPRPGSFETLMQFMGPRPGG